LWAALLGRVPTTGKTIEYGTPEMADEVRRLFQITDVKKRRVLIMAGHEGGIVAFGRDLAEAFAVISALEPEVS
jgi:ribulose-5-phosphate 4-epimerase/fuculose-1-phosphate aldolase